MKGKRHIFGTPYMSSLPPQNTWKEPFLSWILEGEEGKRKIETNGEFWVVECVSKGLELGRKGLRILPHSRIYSKVYGGFTCCECGPGPGKGKWLARKKVSLQERVEWKWCFWGSGWCLAMMVLWRVPEIDIVVRSARWPEVETASRPLLLILTGSNNMKMKGKRASKGWEFDVMWLRAA